MTQQRLLHTALTTTLTFVLTAAPGRSADNLTGELGCADHDSSCAYLECICSLYGGDFEGMSSYDDPDDGYCLCALDDGVVFCADGNCRTFVHGLLIDVPGGDGPADDAACASLWCRLRMFVAHRQHGRIAGLAAAALMDAEDESVVLEPLPPADMFTVTRIDPVQATPVAHPGSSIVGDGGVPSLAGQTQGIIDGLELIAEPGVPEIRVDPGLAIEPLGEELPIICEGDHDGDGQSDGYLDIYPDGAWSCCAPGYGCYVCGADDTCSMACDTLECLQDEAALQDSAPHLAGIDWAALGDDDTAGLTDDVLLPGMTPVLDPDIGNEELPDSDTYPGSRRPRRLNTRGRQLLTPVNAITETHAIP